MTPTTGKLLGRGRDADVYDIGDGRVLRRYRVDYDHADEIAALRHLHDQGFPAPRLYAADGGREMEMERIDGPTMLAELTRAPWRAARYGRMLADLHRRLHEVAPPAGLRVMRDAGERDETWCIVHQDLHPGNVLLSPRGPIVIDWSNVALGPAGRDLAATVIVLRAFDADVRWPKSVAVALLRRMFLRAFRKAAHTNPKPYIAQTCRARLDDPNLRPVEAERLRKLLASIGAEAAEGASAGVNRSA